jgi:addiction module RelB/DinJ family antitoxin
MNTAVINIKTDAKTKSEAQKLADEMGLTLTAVLNRYLRHFIKTKSVTFSAEDETPNNYLIGLMEKAKQDRESGKASPVFDNADEAIKWLHKKTK